MAFFRERVTRCVLRVRCLPRPVKVAILAALGLLAASAVAFAIYQVTGGNNALCAPYDRCQPWAKEF